MQINSRQAVLITSLALAGLLAHLSFVSAQTTQPTPQSVFDRLIHAIRTRDRAEFLSNATDDMKQAVTPEVMDQMNRDLAPHLDKGFDATYLCDLKQDGCKIYLWKVSFKDGSDDDILRIVQSGDQLAGFFRQ